jgi:hypothetical protein
MKISDRSPQARRVYYLGALDAIDRQLKSIQEERNRIAWELDKVMSELLAKVSRLPNGE